MYKHALGPAEGNGKAIYFGALTLIFFQQEFMGLIDGLKHTQEAGGADGDAPATLSTYKISLQAKSLAKYFNLKVVIV